MPSRYLLVEFDDEESALSLKEKIDATQGKKFRVVGLFAKPTSYCQCGVDTWTTTKANPATTKRGRKFGWWVCTQCKRPAASISGLVNLIAPDDIINPQTFDLGKGPLHFVIEALSARSWRAKK